MKFSSLAATAAFVHTAVAIPAYFVTVSCPDAVTITQTVYPPGWTATGPIVGGMTAGGGGAGASVVGVAGAGGGVTTSWTTNYATTTTYCPTPGLYPPPAGLTNSLTAYMPTTFTYSVPYPTGWVFNVADYACTTCSKTVIVIVVISETMVEIMTEYWSVGASTTGLQMTGPAPYTASTIPTTLTPPGANNVGVTPAGAPAGATAPAPTGGAQTGIDFSNSALFAPTTPSGVTIVSTSEPPKPFTRTEPPYTVPLSYAAKYVSVDFSNTALFAPTTPPGVTIVSTSEPPPPFTRTRPPYTVPTSYGANYVSVDFSNSALFTGSLLAGFTAPASTLPPANNVAVSPASAPASSAAPNPSSAFSPAPISMTGTSPATTPAAVVPAGAPPSAVPGVSTSYSVYGGNYPSINMASYFTSIPAGINPVTPVTPSTPVAPAGPAATTPPAAVTPAAVTPAVATGGYGANYPSINFANAFTSVPTGFSFAVGPSATP